MPQMLAHSKLGSDSIIELPMYGNVNKSVPASSGLNALKQIMTA